MEQQRIAIIGLGRIGSAFLSQMLQKRSQGIELVCAAEAADTPGRQLAVKSGIAIKSLDDIVALGNRIDVIFDLTGIPEVRRELRDKLVAAKNAHTVIASETIVRVIWALISQDALPVIQGRKTGY
ncbi:homoserine dehydrogenase [Curvibacter sp. PAE-UM]|uniref:homoserine dehydrogenase n=1 Tax=Curvibacter sp. PAE-UM TaxID=1714344 RepID=UPI0007098D40|nr:homoserine dehydrogenase [Curvibacter sp. PAE-UM]KRI01554.1 homoserine dehydrogenase [Curvibacter sp. PAE-UM]